MGQFSFGFVAGRARVVVVGACVQIGGFLTGSMLGHFAFSSVKKKTSFCAIHDLSVFLVWRMNSVPVGASVLRISSLVI